MQGGNYWSLAFEKKESSKEFINKGGSINSSHCSDNYTPLRGEQQALIL